MNTPGLIIDGAALAVCAVNIACFKHRPVWRGAALAFSGTLGATGAAAARLWLFVPLWLVLTVWGLLALANAKGALNDRERGDREE